MYCESKLINRATERLEAYFRKHGYDNQYSFEVAPEIIMESLLVVVHSDNDPNEYWEWEYVIPEEELSKPEPKLKLNVVYDYTSGIKCKKIMA